MASPGVLRESWGFMDLSLSSALNLLNTTGHVSGCSTQKTITAKHSYLAVCLNLFLSVPVYFLVFPHAPCPPTHSRYIPCSESLRQSIKNCIPHKSTGYVVHYSWRSGFLVLWWMDNPGKENRRLWVSGIRWALHHCSCHGVPFGEADHIFLLGLLEPSGSALSMRGEMINSIHFKCQWF